MPTILRKYLLPTLFVVLLAAGWPLLKSHFFANVGLVLALRQQQMQVGSVCASHSAASRYSSGLQWLETSTSVQNDATTGWAYARILIRDGQPHKALEVMRPIAQASRQNAAFVSAYVALLASEGDYVGAISAYEQSHVQALSQAARDSIALAYIEQGNYPVALKYRPNDIYLLQWRLHNQQLSEQEREVTLNHLAHFSEQSVLSESPRLTAYLKRAIPELVHENIWSERQAQRVTELLDWRERAASALSYFETQRPSSLQIASGPQGTFVFDSINVRWLAQSWHGSQTPRALFFSGPSCDAESSVKLIGLWADADSTSQPPPYTELISPSLVWPASNQGTLSFRYKTGEDDASGAYVGLLDYSPQPKVILVDNRLPPTNGVWKEWVVPIDSHNHSFEVQLVLRQIGAGAAEFGHIVISTHY